MGAGGPFPSPIWPVKGRAERRVWLFAIPPEVDDDAAAVFPYWATAAKFRGRTPEMGERLLDKVLEEWDAGARGEAAEWFARINLVMRRANYATLAELAKNSEGDTAVEGYVCDAAEGEGVE